MLVVRVRAMLSGAVVPAAVRTRPGPDTLRDELPSRRRMLRGAVSDMGNMATVGLNPADTTLPPLSFRAVRLAAAECAEPEEIALAVLSCLCARPGLTPPQDSSEVDDSPLAALSSRFTRAGLFASGMPGSVGNCPNVCRRTGGDGPSAGTGGGGGKLFGGTIARGVGTGSGAGARGSTKSAGS